MIKILTVLQVKIFYFLLQIPEICFSVIWRFDISTSEDGTGVGQRIKRSQDLCKVTHPIQKEIDKKPKLEVC